MDEQALREKLRKLDALASERNPNAHERAAAKQKADALRAKLPKQQPPSNPFTQLWRQQIRDQQARQQVNEKDAADRVVKFVTNNLHKLKPGDQLAAADLASNYWIQGGLTKKQWNVVLMYYDELKKGN